MSTEIIYKEMPDRIKAFSVKNENETYTIVVNKKWIKGSDKEAIEELLCIK